jgi:DNA adenine methylase
LKPVLRYPGAKWNLSEWVIKHLPPHTTYLEPFFGSGAIFFNKHPSHLETINDIDGNVVNLFKIVRDRHQELAELIEMTPWARDEYLESYSKTGDPLEDARRFIVRCWQAHGTRTNGKTGWRNDVQGKQGSSVSKVWRNVPERILTVADRLKHAQIENRPALEIIATYKFPEVLIYADPPYVLNTRSGKMYAHEMTNDDHAKLLETLKEHPGPAVLSGYECPLYDSILNDWTRKTCRAIAEGGREREEVIWLNPIASEALEQTLFGSSLFLEQDSR